MIKTENKLFRDRQDFPLNEHINEKIRQQAQYKTERAMLLAIDITHLQGFKEKRVVELGKKRVRIPGIKEEFWLIAGKGFGDKPTLLLTNVDKNPIIILEMYLTRWKAEESIRFLKQEYNLKDVRVRSYAGLKNTVLFY